MERKRSRLGRSRWLIFAPVAALAFVAPAHAEPVVGLAVTGYTIDQIPPVKADGIYPVCGQGTLDFINATWDYTQNEFGACGSDSFMLHYTGFIQIPEHQTIEFWVASDDGGTVKIGLNEFGVWQDQGCSATETGLVDMPAGVYDLDAYFYENGGGTCFMLAWNIDGQGWSIVPPEAFTNTPVDTTTTTDSTTTTTTEVMPSSTAGTSTTLGDSGQASANTATTTTVPATPSNTTTTSSQPTVTTEPAPPETAPAPPPVIDMLPPDTEPDPPTTEPAPPDTVAMPPQTIAEPVDTVALPPDTIELPPDTEPAPPDTVEPADVVTAQMIAELVAVIDQLTTISPDEVTVEQITQIVESAAFDSLTAEQVAVLAEVISDAPDEVKDAFESAVNVFDDPALSAYVPKGSTVSVAARRVMIAVTAVTMAMAVPMPTGSSTSSTERRQKVQ